MGKSSKKSATKVDVAPVAVAQSGKKGKRGAEKEIEKAVSAKKQKVERDETVVAKQKIEKKLPKKKAASSSSDDSSDDSDSDSDSEPKVVAKKTPVAAAKNGSVVAKKPKEESSSDSESDSDDSDDEKPAAKKQPVAAVKNGSAAVKKAPASDSSSSEDESDSEDEKPAKPAAAVKNGTKKEASSSENESDSDSSDEEEEKKVAAPAASAKAKAESSDSDSEEDDEDTSDSDEEPKATKAKATPSNAGKPVAKQTQADSSSSEESSEDESSEDEPKAQPVKKVQAESKSESSSEESSDEDESDEEETEKQSIKTPKKKDADVEMVDAEKSGSTFQKTPKTPATPQASGSKTLFVGNLSFSVEESNVRNFFKDAGEVVDVRFASDAEGNFRGFGHVEFATAEAAQKAMELHDQELLGRPVRLDLARERDSNRSAFTPQNRDNSFQKGGQAQHTAFVRGFDTSLGEDEIRSALQQHFGSCGEITRISIPKDYESGTVKGICYMDFADTDGFNTALGLDNSDLGGGYYLTVQEAKPRGDNAGGRGGSGGRFGGGGSGGRRGGRFGDRSGRDGGGRFSGARGGRDGGRGRGGRGTPYNKPNMTPQGKKTTFDD